MNQDEHQRERMRTWSLHYSRRDYASPHEACDRADSKLAEFDKRFPAPAAVEVAPVPLGNSRAYTLGYQDGERDASSAIAEELASLRQKARLWDAVASGKVSVIHWKSEIGSSCNYTVPGSDNLHCGSAFPTAEEAVEAAIAAGALK